MPSDHLFGAGSERHHDIRRGRPERAVGQTRDGDDLLAVGEANTGRDLRAAGARAEIEIADVRLRVLLVEDMDALDEVLRRHRARDADGHRHRVAVLDQRRNVEFYLSGSHHGGTDDVAERGAEHRRRRFRRPQGYDGNRAQHGCAAGEAEEPAARGFFMLLHRWSASYSRRLARYATISSSCSADRGGWPRHAWPRRSRPSTR